MAFIEKTAKLVQKIFLTFKILFCFFQIWPFLAKVFFSIPAKREVEKTNTSFCCLQLQRFFIFSSLMSRFEKSVGWLKTKLVILRCVLFWEVVMVASFVLSLNREMLHLLSVATDGWLKWLLNFMICFFWICFLSFWLGFLE